MPIPFWAGHYIGLPFKECGRDPDGLDCWGLVRLVLREQFQVYVPSYSHAYQSTDDQNRLSAIVTRESFNWKSIKDGEEQCGDVVVLRMRGLPIHVGLVLGDHHMIHIEKNINSVIERYQSLRWKNRVTGFFRYHNNKD